MCSSVFLFFLSDLPLFYEGNTTRSSTCEIHGPPFDRGNTILCIRNHIIEHKNDDSMGELLGLLIGFLMNIEPAYLYKWKGGRPYKRLINFHSYRHRNFWNHGRERVE